MRTSEAGVSVVSSLISRQAAARGEASVSSILPDIGAKWCLDSGVNNNAAVLKGCGLLPGFHALSAMQCNQTDHLLVRIDLAATPE